MNVAFLRGPRTVHKHLCCIALLLSLIGCAHEPSSNDINSAATTPSNEFKSGALRLHCESACTLRWSTQSRHLKALHDNKLWIDLAHEVRDIGYVSDLSYYYLGRAAEGLGHTEAAATYYRLALTYLHRCDGWISGCEGFDFPKDIRTRLTGISTAKPSIHAVPTQQPIRRAQYRSGTGFFINSEGLMVTSLHVVDNANQITVTLRGDVKRPAQLLGKNEPCDLAVIKVASQVSHWLPIQRDPLKIKRGSEVLTVGFPQIDLQGFESKVTNGLISSLTGVANNPNFFQISVPIQPGNSGGPLVTRKGQVVGVISSKLGVTPSLDKANVQPENVNYAVKSTCLRDLLRTLPSKYRYEAQKNNQIKQTSKGKNKGERKDMSMVDLTEYVEKTVALVVVSIE